MYDRFNRKLDYLRISVTDLCNLRCKYCMPEEGVAKIPHDKVLSFEQILEVVEAAVGMGVTKVRLTGGEPLARNRIVYLVSMLAQVEGIGDFAMTTNGTLLERFAEPLAVAGLHRVNVSLDTLDPDYYAELTRGGDIQEVLRGIQAARGAGLDPVKLNCVIAETSEEPHAKSVADYAKAEGLELRFIRRMDTQKGEFWTVEGGTGGQCESCNRLRLSSDGRILPCLFSDLAYSVRELGAREAILKAAVMKPESGETSNNMFHAIGG